MSPRLRIWWLWRRVRLVLARWLGRDGARGRGGAPIDADPLGALKGELLSAAERLEEDERLGVPRVGVDYEPVEMTPALEARRDGTLGELIGHQDRRRMHRRRVQRARIRARIAAAGVAAALLLIVTAGTSAVGLGVPVLDELLDAMIARQDATDDRTPVPTDIGSPPFKPNLRPGLGGKTNPLEFPLPGYDGDAEFVSYVTSDGGLCSALTYPPRRPGAEPTAGFGCPGPELVSEGLADNHLLLSGSQTNAEAIVIEGYAAEDVEVITAHPPFGIATTYLGDVSTLEFPEPITFRQFVVVVRPSPGRTEFSDDQVDRGMDYRIYSFTIRLADDQELDVGPFR